MLYLQGWSGFYKAPISKCYLVVTVCVSLFLQLSSAKYSNLFVYNADCLQTMELWRLFASKLVFLNRVDLILGSLLIYYLRIFERRFGPQKYFSSLVVMGFLSTVFEVLIIALFQYNGFLKHTILPSGPYFLIFPFLVPFYCEVFSISLASVFGLTITGKTFIYLLTIQLVGLSIESLIIFFCGLMAGVVYQCNVFQLKEFRLIPCTLSRWVGRYITPMFNTKPPSYLFKPIGATLELQEQEQLDRQEARWMQARQNTSNFMINGIQASSRNLGSSHYTPSPADIQFFVSMGFTAERSEQALVMAEGDISEAITLLQNVIPH